jgi:Fe-S-cluster containining protein
MREKITSATCRSCGACCVSLNKQDAFCDITSTDEERLGKRFVRLNVLRPSPIDYFARMFDGAPNPEGVIKTKWLEVKTGPLKGVSVCACIALRGSVMSKASCSVYEKRPKVCRTAVKPGDQSCRDIREMFLQLVGDQP